MRANRACTPCAARLYAVLAVLGIAHMVVGCGMKVPDRLIKDAPREAKIDIFDAENGVSIAMEGIDKARRDMSELSRVISASRKRRDTGPAGARAVWDARITYLSADLTHARGTLDLAEMKLILARAQVQLIKARVVDRYSLKARGGFNVKKFEDYHAKWEKKARALNERVVALGDQAEKIKEAWEKVRDAYTTSTGDFASVTPEE